MNRVHLTRVGRLARAALAVALAGTAIGFVRPAFAVDEDPGVAAAQAEVDKVRAEMELAFLDVQRDHARVRSDDWARTPLADPFSAVLRDFVKSVRPAPPADDAKAAAEALRLLAERNADPPLTPTSLRVVLVETARTARADSSAAERDLFVAAAKGAFAEARPEDSWDARFLVLPVVASYRAAQARLEEARKKPEPPPVPPPGGPSANPSSVQPEPAPASPRTTADPTDDMILCDRTRVWVGPWTGWTDDIPEKQNKRQQRSVKVVWIDKYEVTCAQYLAFLETLAPSARRPMLPQGWTISDDEVPAPPAGRDRHPVTGVTLAQAMAYAESVGKRLPTADEWERAAGGGEKEARDFPWGASESEKRYSHAGVEPKDTCAVDAFPEDATDGGVVGMAGNVAELVATYTDRTDIGRTGPEKGRQTFVCGGSFRSRASECGPSARWVMDDGAASPTVGFRCVMDDAEYRKRRK